MQSLTTTGKLFKQFIQFLQEQGYQVFWHDINPEDPEDLDVTCNGEHLMPAGVPAIPNDGIVEIDNYATIYLEQGKGGRKMQRVFKDWQAGKMFLGSTKLTPPHLVAHYERIITAAVAMNGEEKAQLADWVGRHVKPDNELATSDWPGWKDVISRVIG
jgi:hypothetical protein